MKLKLNHLLLSFVFFLCWISICWGVTLDDFALTKPIYSSNTNLDVAVKNEFGDHYRVADWNDIRAYYNGGGDMYDFRDFNSMVTRNGSPKWLSNRQYYINYSDRPGQTPYNNFLSHDHLNQLHLGSWYLNNRPILAFNEAISLPEAPDYEIPDFGAGEINWGSLHFYTSPSGYKNKDTVVIIHGWNMDADNDTVLPDWVDDMADAINIRELIDHGGVNVLAWNWQDVANEGVSAAGTSIDPLGPQNYVPGEAINLSREIKSLLGFDYKEDIHLIGHSLGAGIAARTTQYLQNNFNIERLTLLDGPAENSSGTIYGGSASVYLNRLLGDVNSDIFIENYASSIFGAYYSEGDNISNFGLNDNFNNSGLIDHSWVHEWYRETIQNHELKWGYNLESGADYYDKFMYQNGEYNFIEDIGISYTDPYTGTKVVKYEYSNYPLNLRSPSEKTQTILTETDLDWKAVGSAWVYDGEYHGQSASPVYILADLMVPVYSSYLSFDFQMVNWHEGDKFVLSIDDTILYSVLADVFDLDEWYNINDINLSPWAGTQATLSFALITAIDGIHSEFAIRDINIYRYSTTTPEPTTMILFGFGLLSFIGYSRRKN